MSDPLIARLDAALASSDDLRDGISAYAKLLDRFETESRTKPATARANLQGDFVDLTACRYRRAASRNVELFLFSDGANQCLFDATNERTVLMFGITRAIAPNTRDSSYHRGYPTAGSGDDKGHALSHAQGGLEGGPNYFKQSRLVNRRLSAVGNLWRDIETYLSANAGLLAFVRLVYARGNATERPDEVEYSLMNGKRQFRSVIFPN
jgi:hypothetical protein